MSRWRVGLGLLGPLGVAVLLPDPRTSLAQLTDPRPDVVLGAVAMLAAALVVWALVAWAALVACAAIAGHLPGAAGRFGRRLLVAVTLAALRRVVVAAAGISIAAGIGACGAPTAPAAGSAPGAASLAAVTIAAPVGASPVAQNATGGPSGGPIAQGRVLIDLDWPQTAGSTGEIPEPTTGPTIRLTTAPAAASAAGPAAVSAAADASTDSGETADAATASGRADDIPGGARDVDTAGIGTALVAPVGTDHAPRNGSAHPTGSAQHTDRAPAADATTPMTPFAGTPADDVSAAVRSEAPASDAGPSLAGTSGTAGEVDTTIAVVVRPGDSLWAIAAAHLPSGASAASIDASWRQWYAANRDVIGANPNLVIPGQVLLPPRAAATRQGHPAASVSQGPTEYPGSAR